MKFNKILSYSALAVFTLGMLVGCEDESFTENQTSKTFVSFVDMPLPVDVPEGDSKTIEAKIIAGNTSNQDRVISLQAITAENSPAAASAKTTADADEYSFPATVTIPAGSKEGVFQVTFTDVDLGYSGKQLVIGIVPQPGLDMAMSYILEEGTQYPITDRLIITGRRECLANSFTVEIVTDTYGEETTWELYDSDFNLIADGGPYARVSGGGDGESRFLCLEDGNYTFVIYDSVGDGMYDGSVQGTYRLLRYDADGNEIVVASGGDFGENEVVEFSIP